MRYLLHQLLTSSAARRPDAVALVEDEVSLTYEELDVASNRVANLLVRLGVEKGDRVGLYLDKSAHAVIGLYGALKAGATYVPIDPSSPVSRVAYIVDNCGIQCLITSQKKQDSWTDVLAAGARISHLVVSDADEAMDAPAGVELHPASSLDAESAAAPDLSAIDDDLALILYTSGSTGNPKGVMLSHRNVLAFVKWAATEFTIDENDKLSQMAPLHFDLSTFDLFAAAYAGAAVHLVDRQTLMFPTSVRKFLQTHEITVTYAVPSILTALVEHGRLSDNELPHLRTALFAGEVFPTKYLSRIMRLLPGVEFANLYGPTETNVCTFYRVVQPPDEDEPPISIGKAIANVETVVVDAEGGCVRPGDAGELYVRGATVMQGYWGDPEKTERTRLPNPFSPQLDDWVFRTGDMVIEQPDGNYTFLGRRDSQIKTRGYRVELGEIEAVLLGHDDVVECAVVPVPDELITNRIVAFVVAANRLDEQSIVDHVADRLATQFIPERMVLMDALPKTSTGKIHRQRLTAAATEGEHGQ